MKQTFSQPNNQPQRQTVNDNSPTHHPDKHTTKQPTNLPPRQTANQTTNLPPRQTVNQTTNQPTIDLTKQPIIIELSNQPATTNQPSNQSSNQPMIQTFS